MSLVTLTRIPKKCWSLRSEISAVLMGGKTSTGRLRLWPHIGMCTRYTNRPHLSVRSKTFLGALLEVLEDWTVTLKMQGLKVHFFQNIAAIVSHVVQLNLKQESLARDQIWIGMDRIGKGLDHCYVIIFSFFTTQSFNPYISDLRIRTKFNFGQIVLDLEQSWFPLIWVLPDYFDVKCIKTMKCYKLIPPSPTTWKPLRLQNSYASNSESSDIRSSKCPPRLNEWSVW